MSVFTEKELAYLHAQRIGRLATVDGNCRAHVVPTGFRVAAEPGVIEIGGHELPEGQGRQRQYRRNIERNPHVAFVVDDVASADPWTPRGITIRGTAEIQQTGGERLGPGFGPVWVRIVPARITSWGIEAGAFEPPHSRRTNLDTGTA